MSLTANSDPIPEGEKSGNLEAAGFVLTEQTARS